MTPTRTAVALFLLSVMAMLAPGHVLAVTRSEALAICETSRAFITNTVAPPYEGAMTVRACLDIPDPVVPNAGKWRCSYDVAAPYNVSDAGCGDAYNPPAYTFVAYDEPDIQCDTLNDNPETAPGTRLCMALDCVPRCIGGCSLDITGDPLATLPGRVEGQPVVYYKFAQSYTGETCDAEPPPPDDFIEQDDGKECVPELGICVANDGTNEYCTFNPDGTPNACVPAVDYDGDGIPDESDAAPGDPTNGADEGEGDESDNAASGGGTCQAAPTCTGDGIACATLYQQWKTRCAIEALARDGIPGGTGDDETGTFDPNTAAAQGSDPHPSLSDVIETGDGAEMVASLDDSGFGLGRSCPALALPTFELGGVAMAPPWETLCTWLSLLASMIVLVGYFHAGWIVMKATGG